ncbi:MAG: MMPL family transporter [Sedimentisphaerales bacterium]|nr:MMPL family transporter [Sedimentisphaerales bacterium]
MELKEKITEYSLKHHKFITIVMVVFTLVLASFIYRIKVDTDPENMLSEDEAVRVFHDQTKKKFNLSDLVVVGVVNNKDPNGVYNPDSLDKIYKLAEFSKKLQWEDTKDPNKTIGVIDVDLLAPSTVDHIGQGGPGVVTFEYLMNKPPQTTEEALEIKAKALSNPILEGTVFSEDGKAICLYLPLTSKNLSHRVYKELNKQISTFSGDEKYYITGLPVAEDTFGVEMFIQMAISAPLAMIIIFILMLLFFRKLVLVISPMIIAMVSVLSTMGLLIGLGYPVHIMSSMIPIFLMPIAVVDSVHILSEFFDLYTKEKGRKETMLEVMSELFMPMLYTSLTSAAGFASLALTPIPPVQIFGIFVAIGIMIAWIFTVTFVPAYIMFIKENSLENFGMANVKVQKQTILEKILHNAGLLTFSNAKPILAVLTILTGIAIYGITQIQINDNPVKWFSKSHPIREADIELNKHFSGTYMAYLVLEPTEWNVLEKDYSSNLSKNLSSKVDELKDEIPRISEIWPEVEKEIPNYVKSSQTKSELLDILYEYADEKLDIADDNDFDSWYEIRAFFDLEKEHIKPFKQPDILKYISSLQEYAAKQGFVGKSTSVSDVVKKVHQELQDGTESQYKIPDSFLSVAQCLILFQSSHNQDDLWRMVTPDFTLANIWMQLPSGDNKDMQKVVKAVDEFLKNNPPPAKMNHHWAGLTYINVVWQDKMVWGMLQSFMGSFIIVFIMMAILFRSPLWGLVCMVPLTITIIIIYGIIGLVGKDYDMPVAVLSALTLGMAVDFAIHFLERARTSYDQTGSWQKSTAEMFGEPARAISRNVLVIAIGFLPLLAAPLIPYKTVGIFLCAIMGLSGAVTLFALPAIIKLMENALFKPIKQPTSATCNCSFCIIISIASVALVALNIYQYGKFGSSKIIVLSVIIITVMALSCSIISRRRACKNIQAQKKEDKKN